MPGPDNKAYKGWRGTIRAALTHNPEKFSKEACKKKGKKGGKLCPYAVFTKKKEEGDTPHYKEQPHTTSGTPKKKEKFKEEKEEVCASCGHPASDHAQGRSNKFCEHPDCDCSDFVAKKTEWFMGFKEYAEKRDVLEEGKKKKKCKYFLNGSGMPDDGMP